MHLSPRWLRLLSVLRRWFCCCWPLFIVFPLWESAIVLCFVVRNFMFILVLQSSWWGRESWLLCLICLPGVSWWLSGSSSRCHGVVCGLWLWYLLTILTPSSQIFYWLFQYSTSFVYHLRYLCPVFIMLSRLFIAAQWSPEGKGMTSWLLFMMFNVILLLLHLSWDRFDTWLYRFLILAVLLTLLIMNNNHRSLWKTNRFSIR